MPPDAMPNINSLLLIVVTGIVGALWWWTKREIMRSAELQVESIRLTLHNSLKEEFYELREEVHKQMDETAAFLRNELDTFRKSFSQEIENNINQQFQALSATLSSMQQEISSVQKKLGEHEVRLNAIEKQLQEVKDQLGTILRDYVSQRELQQFYVRKEMCDERYASVKSFITRRPTTRQYAIPPEVSDK